MKRLMASLPLRVAMVGTGNVSLRYLRYLPTSPDVVIATLSDIDMDAARMRAAEFGVGRACPMEEAVSDPGIDIVLNLTPPAAHAIVTRAALESGKHVYSEKPLAMSLDEGRGLVALADEMGCRLACAPDTILAPHLMTGRALIDGGAIGTPVAASCSFVTPGSELWHPSPEFFYQPGAGPVFDEGPYFLSALVTLLGPVAEVSAKAATFRPERKVEVGPRAGAPIVARTPTHVVALLRLASGVLATLTMSFEVLGSTQPPLEIYGTSGTLRFPFPGYYGGGLRLGRKHDGPWQVITPDWSSAPDQDRGVGVEELARAIVSGDRSRMEAPFPLHILDLMETILRAAETGKNETLQTTCDRPAPYHPAASASAA